MARATYTFEDLGNEVGAPSGYYHPLEYGFLEHQGRRVLFIRGTACIEASCCGVGSWNYLRVEGYVVDTRPEDFEIDTVEFARDRAAIRGLLQKQHPSARIEFR